MKYDYFPGCSLEWNAAAYNQSTISVSKSLGFELEEIEDWNCCGATEYISLNLIASYALIARNLAQASKTGTQTTDLVAPCSACYLNLRKCDQYMGANKDLANKINLALSAGGLSYKPGRVRVRHLLDVLVEDVGFQTIRERVTQPLKGLKVAPYYGCMIVRPDFRANGTPAYTYDREFPNSLDELLESLGAEVVDFPVKTQCCGGHMTQISESTGFELISRIIKTASDCKADLIATICPMCQLNLDAYQGGMNAHFKTDYKMPVVYFTQLMGLAFGESKTAVGIGSELVDPTSALAKIGAEADLTDEKTAPGKASRPKKDDKSLPMPTMRKTKREVVR
jgi:heterodisulfide reductase subunit B2